MSEADYDSLNVTYQVKDAEACVDRYFRLIEEIKRAKQSRDFERMLAACKDSIVLLPFVIQSIKRECGSFDLGLIPAITQGCIIWSVFGNVSEIVKAQKFCSRLNDLDDWIDDFEKAKRRVDLVNRIKTFIVANPGFPKNKLKKSLGEASVLFLANDLHYMEVVGLVDRERTGKTYRLLARKSVW